MPIPAVWKLIEVDRDFVQLSDEQLNIIYVESSSVRKRRNRVAILNHLVYLRICKIRLIKHEVLSKGSLPN